MAAKSFFRSACPGVSNHHVPIKLSEVVLYSKCVNIVNQGMQQRVFFRFLYLLKKFSAFKPKKISNYITRAKI